MASTKLEVEQKILISFKYHSGFFQESIKMAHLSKDVFWPDIFFPLFYANFQYLSTNSNRLFYLGMYMGWVEEFFQPSPPWGIKKNITQPNPS